LASRPACASFTNCEMRPTSIGRARSGARSLGTACIPAPGVSVDGRDVTCRRWPASSRVLAERKRPVLPPPPGTGGVIAPCSPASTPRQDLLPYPSAAVIGCRPSIRWVAPFPASPGVSVRPRDSVAQELNQRLEILGKIPQRRMVALRDKTQFFIRKEPPLRLRRLRHHSPPIGCAHVVQRNATGQRNSASFGRKTDCTGRRKSPNPPNIMSTATRRPVCRVGCEEMPNFRGMATAASR
jgi:hypothetical protein